MTPHKRGPQKNVKNLLQDHVRRRLEQKTQELLHTEGDALHEAIPSNVEPGFESSFKQRSHQESQSQQLRKR